MAGLLGQIFSAGNVAKRQLRDLLGNPVLSAQQFVGNLNDRARNLNEMTSAAAREGMDYGPATQRLAGLMAEGYNPMGLTVFHGSPAKFNRFDRTKIGSGEGAQAFGYGHYVAESPKTAQSYSNKLTKVDGQSISDQLDSRTRYLDMLKQQAAEGDVNAAKNIPVIEKSISDLVNKGNVYEIDLPDEQIARMLDLDKPLSKQPVAVQSYLKDAFNPYRDQLTAKDIGGNEPTGSLILNRLQELMSEGRRADVFTNSENLGARNASQELLDAGIPGIRYMDEASRGQGQGTSNFVVFPGNEDMLTILKRNGGLLEPQPKNFETSVSDASEIFGQGAKRIKYTDPNSGGMIDVLQKPDGTASVLGLEVPEQMRGQGIGQALQSQVMQDFPEMMGQVSSKAAAKTAYRLGRRPPNAPDATLDDVYKIMDEYSSVNLVSPDMQKRFIQSLLD